MLCDSVELEIGPSHADQKLGVSFVVLNYPPTRSVAEGDPLADYVSKIWNGCMCVKPGFPECNAMNQ